MEVPSGREWLFSVRTFAAGMTALWVVLWLNLDRPYWALASAYIASQSFAGATRSKAAFRAMGTVIGGLAALVMVPALVDAPPLLSLVLALWVGTCLFFALLDRTPRSYVFMLGGYTAAIIGFPSVDAPGAIFDTVLARVEEILIGIGTAALFGSVLFPRPIGPAVGQLVTRWLATADQWAGEVFAGRTGETGHLEYRRQLASGIVEVDALAGSLAWDPGTGWLEARSMRVLRQDMLLLLLMLASVEDRVEALGADGRAEAEGVLRAAGAWVADGAPSGASSGEVAAGAAALKAGTAGRTDWPGLLLGSFADRMGDFAALRAECGALRREVAGLERPRFASAAAGSAAPGSRHGAALGGCCGGGGAAGMLVLDCVGVDGGGGGGRDGGGSVQLLCDAGQSGADDFAVPGLVGGGVGGRCGAAVRGVAAGELVRDAGVGDGAGVAGVRVVDVAAVDGERRGRVGGECDDVAGHSIGIYGGFRLVR